MSEHAVSTLILWGLILFTFGGLTLTCWLDPAGLVAAKRAAAERDTELDSTA